MTQRTRQAIMDYWIAKHTFYWRRYSRFFLLLISFSVVLSETTFAAEPQANVTVPKMVSREKSAENLKKVPAKVSKPMNPDAKLEPKKNGEEPFVLDMSAAVAAASPARAKTITDEELRAFLNSPAVPVTASKQAAAGPAAAASVTTAPVTTAVVRTDEEPQALKEDEQLEKSSVIGVVSAIGKQGIAVEYSHSKSGSQEMYLPFTRPVKVTNVASLDLLQAGDKVRVEFERAYKERSLKDAKGKDRDKKEKIILRTTVTGVEFMSRPPADTLKSMEAAE